MQPAQIQCGKIYEVWMSRRLRPVLIQRRNVHGGWDGIVWPGGNHVRVKNAKAVSQESRVQIQAAMVDYKSRAAGDRD